MFNNIFDPKTDIGITGLNNELKAIYIYNTFIKTRKPIVFVCSTLYEATNFYQRLLNYTDSVVFFPMDDFLTSEAVAISPELKTTRLETLNEIIKKPYQILVTNLMGYLRFLPTKSEYKKSIITMVKNSDYDIKKLIHQLFSLGYQKETMVTKTGEYATRGYVIDFFPIGYENPVRIEFWGDFIESIRTFDVNTQRTVEKIEEVIVYPNTEFITDNKPDVIEEKHHNLFNYTKTVNINDYLTNSIVFFDDYTRLKTSYQLLLEEIFEYNLSLGVEQNKKYMNDFNEINTKETVYFEDQDNPIENVNEIKKILCEEIEIFTGTRETINNRLNQYLKSNKEIIICLSNIKKAKNLINFLENDNLFITNEKEIYNKKINIIIKKISSGFIYNDLVVISETELFNHKENNIKYKTNFKYGAKIKDITKLVKGDFVVHETYGIGRYLGIKTLLKAGLKKDYLQIEYKNNDKLYIPVEKIEHISKFSSSEGTIPKINSLNTNEWKKIKLKAQKRVENIAGELLKLYAAREERIGFRFSPDTEEQHEFEKDFPYTETIDQIKVVEEIKKDMESIKPMDRLLCGDVGYGKTEVAFRAAFKAIMSGKQVAFLCPTTILSNQHYNNAIERFKNYAINISLLNRFVTGNKKNQVIDNVKNGKVDVLIGTHRLLSNDVVFKDLGLLIVDEEQRFGVKHKEKIKQFKNNVDVLTLSATPIPRTLQMSMSGIRSLSLIETPPVDRYPIQTYVLAENKQVIKDAIYKEISRKGQVFILYNKVKDMDLKVKEIKELVPEARVISAHGQMNKSELEEIMIKFINRDYDVLVCTTIIETGIDIPTVNTLIIIDANNFGLSQLYQIRGRVGRSNVIAYCYLTYDKNKILTETAVKRLKVIKEFTELGSGFSIAMRDLSIRGAGDILGSEQAGFVDSVGIELFMSMLNEEVNRLKGITFEKEAETDDQPLIDVETFIDDKYVENEDLKIFIHKKISTIDSYEKLNQIKQEIEDRFGKIDDKMLIYMHEEWFEKLAKKLQLTKIRQTKNFIEIVLNKKLTDSVKVDDLFYDVSKMSRMFRFSLKNHQLIITLDTINLDKHFVYYLIELLQAIEKNRNA